MRHGATKRAVITFESLSSALKNLFATEKLTTTTQGSARTCLLKHPVLSLADETSQKKTP